jgi:hypothetical protein
MSNTPEFTNDQGHAIDPMTNEVIYCEVCERHPATKYMEYLYLIGTNGSTGELACQECFEEARLNGDIA